jgi:hypothetical protein
VPLHDAEVGLLCAVNAIRIIAAKIYLYLTLRVF